MKLGKILLVDDEPANLALLKGILEEDFELFFAKEGIRAIELAQEHAPDIALLDIMMPGMNGYEVCTALKKDCRPLDIAVIFVTAMSDISDEAEGFMVGAVDYIAKPVSPALVMARVQTQLKLPRMNISLRKSVHQQVDQHQRLLETAIEMLGEAGHYNDTDTGVHIWRMAAYAKALATAAGWSEEDSRLLELAAPLHDTGKIGIPDSVLKKPGKLDREEWEIMKRHAEIGAQILRKSDSPLFYLASEIAQCHHEKWDGSGYPGGLSGTDIPESARIVAIADVFDALTMKRPYKEPWSIEEAFSAIREGAGRHFDPELVRLFLTMEDGIIEIRDQWNREEEFRVISY
ncbi:HD-GYP domain-containing protein [Aestuariispira insulae]|uniref:Putative two-component system response regulator n=1 Tax=Aestuariispira insulae TaxID=1461337 RepID=A0A3D9HRL6_9PROT|nr:HD domain-containing phosphohydrolase [Aestuariispira insulae]RED52099.1 putative two-component system response regulator [Aestuariispira insulae]